MPVIDEETGWYLKYRQLPKHPKYQKFGMNFIPINLADCAKA